LLKPVGEIVSGLPGVFSTAQWGGRAYKLPGVRGDRKKPRLLAHVTFERDRGAVHVEFKLPKDRADALVSKYDWVNRHSFATLARSGWVAAEVTSARQLGMLGRWLAESRALHPDSADREQGAKDEAEGISPKVRIQRIIARAAETGWRPAIDCEEFDGPPRVPPATKAP